MVKVNLDIGKRQGAERNRRSSSSRIKNNCPASNVLNFKMKLTNNHATCKIPQCIESTANLLINTGADLNLIKLNTLQYGVLVSNTKIYKMQGIGDKLVNTLGSAMY